MLLKDVIDVASYLFENKKSLRILETFQAIVLYYTLIQAILVIKPLSSFCKRVSCAIAIYIMGVTLVGLLYLLLRERAKPDKKDTPSPEDVIQEYLSHVSWKELMGTTTITKETLERTSLEITDLLVNRFNSISLSKATYKMIRSIASGSRILPALLFYALVWMLVYLGRDIPYNSILRDILEPSLMNLGMGAISYMLLTLLITLTTGLLSPLLDTLNASSKNIHSSRAVRYILAMLIASLFPYFTLDQVLNSPKKPEVWTFTILYKINNGDPPSQEFLRFVQILFESKDNEKYSVYSPLTQKQITREDFENAIQYQLQNVVSTTPGVMSSVYLIHKYPETVSIAIFTIETELRYNLKRTQKTITNRRGEKTIEKTVITDPKQIYLLKIVEISPESVIQGILFQIGHEILEGKLSLK
ncbi:hypothetical protein [Thermococcus sp.]|uniref:hypothetical protein n=1 Tax=Thermococcus sp. TaxID=35749 RepID=UPI00261D7C1B|nr:hypothetical protein [Thermococcus sp.]